MGLQTVDVSAKMASNIDDTAERLAKSAQQQVPVFPIVCRLKIDNKGG